jgi:hypothetical protein
MAEAFFLPGFSGVRLCCKDKKSVRNAFSGAMTRGVSQFAGMETGKGQISRFCFKFNLYHGHMAVDGRPLGMWQFCWRQQACSFNNSQGHCS